MDNSGRGPAFEAPMAEDDDYLDGYLASLAVEALEEFSGDTIPFFLAVGFHKPHLPFNAPKKYWDLYDEQDIILPGNDSLPLNYTEHTLYNFGELRNYAGIPKGGATLDDALKKQLKHGYYACVSFMDAQLGRILDKLAVTGLDKNTIVVLWGDHGWKLGEHNMWCKHTNFELDTRVPLIIKVPGREAGSTDSFAELLDIYPTLAELCGFEPPAHVEGTSLLDNIANPRQNTRQAAYSLYPHGRNNPEKLVMGYSVRTDAFRYIQWKRIMVNTIVEEELYDHRVDPGENVNVAGDIQYAHEKKNLAEMLKERWRMDSSIFIQ
jgi:arylsulfatase A-like enzyme